MIIILIIAVIAILFCLCLVEMRRELKDFRMSTYEIRSPKLHGIDKEKTVLFLSDLHNRTYGKKNERLLRAIREQNPDLILIGGDMLVRKDGNSYEGTLEFLKKLPDICPVYYANGNHEQKLKELPESYLQSYADYRKELLNAGIQMLENDSQKVNLDSVNVTITGLEIPLWAYTKIGKKNLPAEEIEKRIGVPDGSYQILLAHHPGYMKEYLAYGADLVLSGHYHGCVVQIPGIGGVISPNFTLFPKYSGGIYREKEADVVVSRGLGTHSVPIRLFNWPELVVLKLSGETTGENIE